MQSVVSSESTVTVTLPYDILFILANLCGKEELLRLRLVSHHLNGICLPLLYRLLVQEIRRERCFHLHRAAAICYDTATRRLLEEGAPVMHCNAIGETALHIAAGGNCIPGVRRLLHAQADVDARTIHDWTSLQLAARHGHDVLVRILLQHGANPDSRGFHGWTALHYAARSGHLAVVKSLVEAGSNVGITDNDGGTAAQEAKRFGHREILEFLTSQVCRTK